MGEKINKKQKGKYYVGTELDIPSYNFKKFTGSSYLAIRGPFKNKKAVKGEITYLAKESKEKKKSFFMMTQKELDYFN